jgi:hypothetical protein
VSSLYGSHPVGQRMALKNITVSRGRLSP